MGHLTNMVDDQYDYYLYSMRKYTLDSFEGLMKFNDGALYRYRPIIKACGDLVRLVSQVEKCKAVETEKFKALYDEYLESAEYKKLKQDIFNAVEDDEEYKKDQDPLGYHKYNDLVSCLSCNPFYSSMENTLLTALWLELPAATLTLP
jgi:hypothetical protein